MRLLGQERREKGRVVISVFVSVCALVLLYFLYVYSV